jgi:hypothetical protein
VHVVDVLAPREEPRRGQRGQRGQRRRDGHSVETLEHNQYRRRDLIAEGSVMPTTDETS